MKASLKDILWLLSGDLTVMADMLLDVPEIVQKAQEVVDGKAGYDELLELSYEYF